jgi:hypothetical protein
MQTRENQLGLSNLSKELIRQPGDDVEVETPTTPEA